MTHQMSALNPSPTSKKVKGEKAEGDTQDDPIDAHLLFEYNPKTIFERYEVVNQLANILSGGLVW
jgi:hypothetical protein